MTIQLKLPAILIMACIAGCTITPDYLSPEGKEIALISTKSAGSKWICVDDEPQWLKADSTGYAKIPAGSRVTIGSKYSVDTGISTISCNPRSSIIPEAGQRYYIDFTMETERCFAFIFKEDPSNRTGLARDWTFGPSHYTQVPATKLTLGKVSAQGGGNGIG